MITAHAQCPVCSAAETGYFGRGRDFLFETTDELFTLLRCAGCGSVFIDPMPDSGRIASFYPDSYWWDSDAGALSRLESLYRRIALVDHVGFITRAARKARPAGRARILDVGCGPGTLLSLLERKGFEVVGVDVSDRAAEIARTKHGIKVHVGPLPAAAIPGAGFDAVVMLHVLEHVPNPKEVLAESLRLLAPEGRLVVQAPNVDSLQSRLFRTRWYGLDVPRHLIDYSERSLLHMLESSGFQIERVRHFNLRDNAPALASSLFPDLDPVSRSVRIGRRRPEPQLEKWVRRCAYLAVVTLCYLPAAMEAALGRGATLMVEARKAAGR